MKLDACYAFSHDRPLRISSLSSLVRCPGFLVSRAIDDSPGKPAQNGSAVGRVIQLAHEGVLLEEALAQTERESENWPLADMAQVREWATPYCLDERNGPGSDFGPVVPGSCEMTVKLMLPPDEDDPTGLPIHLRGHIDQLREERGTGILRVWDVKSGRGTGQELLAEYAWQLAIYSAACTATLGRLVLPGGIIRLRSYERHGPTAPGVFWEAPWTPEDVASMVGTVAHDIGVLRAGKIPLRPGLHCQWCPAAPFWSCHQRVPDLPMVGS